MTLAQDFEDFIMLLNRHKVEYSVVGDMPLLSMAGHAILATWIAGSGFPKSMLVKCYK